MLRITSVGDIMLGRGISADGPNNLDELVTAPIVSLLDGDIVTGNLECVLGDAGKPNPIAHSHFRCEPYRAINLLKRFDVLSLANNHINDFGLAAVDRTLDFLDQIGVRHVGVGRSSDEAYAPVILEASMRVAILGATTVSTLGRSDGFFVAKPGEKLWKSLANASAVADVVVLHMHTGGGDFRHPAPMVRKLMQGAVKAGADIVFGHHPHVVQGWERLGPSVVFYSLGDFLFDRFEDGRESAVVASVNFSAGKEDLADIGFSPVIRTENLHLTLPGEQEAIIFEADLERLNNALQTGESDAEYRKWFGNPLRRALASTLTDLRKGGVRALVSKIGRIDQRRISLFIDQIFGRR